MAGRETLYVERLRDIGAKGEARVDAGSTKASDCELNAIRRLKQQSKMFATVLLSAFLPFYL